MSTNRRRRLENTVPVGAYSPWFLIAILALVGGLTWIYYKNQLFHRGTVISAKEKELSALVRKNEDLKSRNQKLSTFAALQKRCDDGTIKMVRIPQTSIVHVEFPHRAGGSEIRAVSNEGARR